MFGFRVFGVQMVTVYQGLSVLDFFALILPFVERRLFSVPKFEQCSQTEALVGSHSFKLFWTSTWLSSRGGFHKLFCILRQTFCALRPTFEKLFEA